MRRFARNDYCSSLLPLAHRRVWRPHARPSAKHFAAKSFSDFLVQAPLLKQSLCGQPIGRDITCDFVWMLEGEGQLSYRRRQRHQSRAGVRRVDAEADVADEVRGRHDRKSARREARKRPLVVPGVAESRAHPVPGFFPECALLWVLELRQVLLLIRFGAPTLHVVVEMTPCAPPRGPSPANRIAREVVAPPRAGGGGEEIMSAHLPPPQ